jgi:chromosome segregation ATPase
MSAASTERLRLIAAARLARSDAEDDALEARLQARINSILIARGDLPDVLAGLDAEIANDSAALATANAALGPAQAQSTSKAAQIASLQDQVELLQQQIADGVPPGAQEDIAERDQVVALADAWGVTW